jgi:hypothetical protein
MSALNRRLTKLESGGSGFVAIVVKGGLPGGREDDFANADAMNWTRAAGEDATEFRNRAKAEARAAGVKTLVFGGLKNG